MTIVDFPYFDLLTFPIFSVYSGYVVSIVKEKSVVSIWYSGVRI